ncbi:zinc finger protein 2 homolog [Contarinia nasturtii]|uniref:zinc finger protein 2 homolog n=1 Tax=Contarinia nasturtii TaxID=265458 RepID=UPI0012D39F90|nr:zinc finger protein 2 homolog [Contarinia nasturtii]
MESINEATIIKVKKEEIMCKKWPDFSLINDANETKNCEIMGYDAVGEDISLIDIMCVEDTDEFKNDKTDSLRTVKNKLGSEISEIIMERIETVTVKIEPSFGLGGDESEVNNGEILDMPIQNIFTAVNNTQEFYIGDEEVDLTSADALSDAVREDISLIDMMRVEDTDEDAILTGDLLTIDMMRLEEGFYLNETLSDSIDISDSFLFKENVPNNFKQNQQVASQCNIRIAENSMYSVPFDKGKHGSQRLEYSFGSKKFRKRSQPEYYNRIDTGEKLYACEECPMRFAFKGSLVRHKKLHTGEKPFQCNICLTRFATKAYLKVHATTHSDETPYHCHLCTKNFKRKRLLGMHISKNHENENLSEKNNEMMYTCDECPSAFISIPRLNRHKQNHSRAKCFRCVICSIEFSIRQQYISHMNTHSTLLQCQLCSHHFTSKKDLTIHMTIHEKQNSRETRLFQCTKCSKTFTSKSSLNRHTPIHSNNKPFQCSICQKQFLLKSYLKEHIKIHSGQRAFGCVQCSKTFSRRSRLELHKKSHLNEAYLNIKSEIVVLTDDE